MTAILKMLGPGEGAEFALTGAPFVLGRDAVCDVVLDDPSVSKKHAQILLVDGEYILRDQNSHNGTFVGDERITHRVLNSGDIVGVGPYKMLFLAVDDQPGAGEIVVARGDAGEASIAVASEVQRMDREINARIRELEAIEDKSQRSWSKLLTIAIVVVAIGGLIVLLRMSGEETHRLSGVELDTRYAQIARIPPPKNFSTAYIECLDPDTLAPSKLLDIDCLVYRKSPDAEGVDGERTHDRELAEIGGGYVFVRVTPGDAGSAVLRITADDGVVYYMLVDVVDRPNDEWAEIEKYKNDKNALQGLLERARGAKDANPAMALKAIKIARSVGLANIAEMDKIEGEAKDNLKAKWEAIRRRLIVAYRRNLHDDIIAALNDLLALIPDPEDERNQWARIMLKPYEDEKIRE